MTKRMLIDSTHAEETRVVVLDGNRLEDYDVETSTKQQLKGNIYLAKIVRVEPSLQAAFVEFGGGRHGFLAFGEIHPDYYQIPVADRKRLIELQEAEAREEEEAAEREEAARERSGSTEAEDAPRRDRTEDPDADGEAEPETAEPIQDGESDAADDAPAPADGMAELAYATQADPEAAQPESENQPGEESTAEDHHPKQQAEQPQTFSDLPDPATPAPDQVAQPATIAPEMVVASEDAHTQFPEAEAEAEAGAGAEPAQASGEAGEDTNVEPVESDHHVETLAPEAPEQLGGELDTEERADRNQPSRFMRHYKIQEVIRRRQIMLVQVVKEERGNKGAALTTYISLAGRFSVLMPNSPRGGGISRKITSAADRRRLKEVTTELDLPRGMGLIVRTAGAQRPKAEIVRDCEYLLSQWDQIRDLTMKSVAPALIYEEASLIKRAIRDVYSREVEEILVDGEAGWTAARDFMRMLMPSHARKVQLWRDPQPLFAKAQVENQLDAMLQPTVQLRSGGYLVINQTEALVAIDVNSGRSTRERGIEETALRTNLEAAEEAARQLRLRDLAGLIVIDFIDMESRRNNASVERRLKDALKNDRARIQVGSISHFGLLEMSRQRLRPSLTETSFSVCPHCGGSGHIRSTESAALAVLRGIEDEGAKRRAAEIVVHVHGSVALYILNHKRVRVGEIEARFGMQITFQADEGMIPPAMRIERIRALAVSEAPMPISPLPPPEPFEDPDEETAEAEDTTDESMAATAGTSGADAAEGQAGGESEDEQRRRKRRRRRRGGRREDGTGEEGAGEQAGEMDAGGDLANDEAVTADAEAAIGLDPSANPEDATEPMTAADADQVPEASQDVTQGAATAEPGEDAEAQRKRRGRRGGRRRRRDADSPAETAPDMAADAPSTSDDAPEAEAPEAAQPEAPQPSPAPSRQAYVGPTPANPFGGQADAYSFFDAVEEVDDAHARPASPQTTTTEVHDTTGDGSTEPPPAAIVVEKKRGWWRR